MSKFFTVLSAIVLLVVAAAHAARAYFELPLTIGLTEDVNKLIGLPVVNGGYAVPVVASWVCAGVCAVLAVMIFVELAKKK